VNWAALALFLAQPAADPAPSVPVVEAPRIVPDGRCERPSENLSEQELVVCGRRVEPDRYRLPIRPGRFDPKGAVDSVSRERNRLIEEADGGIGACTNVGVAGPTGCFGRAVKRRCEQEGCGIAF
jgi:hypothetical protein